MLKYLLLFLFLQFFLLVLLNFLIFLWIYFVGGLVLLIFLLVLFRLRIYAVVQLYLVLLHFRLWEGGEGGEYIGACNCIFFNACA